MPLGRPMGGVGGVEGVWLVFKLSTEDAEECEALAVSAAVHNLSQRYQKHSKDASERAAG